jgi:hypothetical protein
MPDPRPTPADAVRDANRSAARSFGAKPADAPCETCPNPTPATELDGALIGAGCEPVTNPRARGRLQPRHTYVAVHDPDPIRPRVRMERRQIDPSVPRQGLTSAEIREAGERATRSETECCKRKREQEGERTIVYVNGIMTTPAAHCATLANIANLTCARVIGVYNATQSFPADLMQVARDRALVEQAAAGRNVPVGDRRNPAVDTMRDLVVESQLDPSTVGGQPLELMAHSQGGAITSLALFQAKADLRRESVAQPLKSVRVTSFNGAAPRWVDGPRYEHYVHLGDFVGTETGIGKYRMQESRVGRDATVIAFSDSTTVPGPAFVWQEVRHDGVQARGRGVPERAASSYQPWNASRHGVDDVGLGIYQQRSSAVGSPTCTANSPGAAAPPSTPR